MTQIDKFSLYILCFIDVSRCKIIQTKTAYSSFDLIIALYKKLDYLKKRNYM
jgi:hypothetical protein